MSDNKSLAIVSVSTTVIVQLAVLVGPVIGIVLDATKSPVIIGKNVVIDIGALIQGPVIVSLAVSHWVVSQLF